MKNKVLVDEGYVNEKLKDSGYEVQDFLDSCSHFLVFYLADGNMINIVHFIGRINNPTDDDIVSAYEELAINEEFGVSEIFDDLNHFVATREEMQQNFPEVLKVDM